MSTNIITPLTQRSEVDRKIEGEKRYFIEKMSLDDCERFQALENLYCQSSDIEQMESFSHGFKLATMLMCEVFMKESQMYSKE